MSWVRSALRLAQRGTVDSDSVAAVTETAEQGLDEGLVAEEVGPLGIVEVGGDDGGALRVAFLHQFEEDVGLLGAEVEIAHLVDNQEVDASEVVEQLARGAVGEGC